MSKKEFYIGSQGPFFYDDADDIPGGGGKQQAFKSDGDVEVGNVAITSLTTNMRLMFSDTDKTMKELENVTVFIQDGHGIDVVSIAGVATIELIALLEDILDVDILSEDPGDVLIRNAANTKWVNFPSIYDWSLSYPDDGFNLSVQAMNHLVLVNATGGDVHVNLPEASQAYGRPFRIVKKDSSANEVIVAVQGAGNINGSATQVLTAQWQSAEFFSDGTQWYMK